MISNDKAVKNGGILREKHHKNGVTTIKC